EPPEPVRALAPHVPAELEAVVMRALEKAPEDRWQSARDFARALVPAVEKRARPSSTRSDVTDVIERPRAPRSPAFFATPGFALALLVVALGLVALRARPGGMLIVISDPAGADVVVDGRATGERTPASLTLAPGEHTVGLHHAQYTDLERVVRIGDRAREVV